MVRRVSRIVASSPQPLIRGVVGFVPAFVIVGVAVCVEVMNGLRMSVPMSSDG
jgi:hypothetical protein